MKVSVKRYVYGFVVWNEIIIHVWDFWVLGSELVWCVCESVGRQAKAGGDR